MNQKLINFLFNAYGIPNENTARFIEDFDDVQERQAAMMGFILSVALVKDGSFNSLGEAKEYVNSLEEGTDDAYGLTTHVLAKAVLYHCGVFDD